MAEERVTLIAMRRPELDVGRREQVPFIARSSGGEIRGLREVHEMLLEGGPVEVDSFPDAVRAAAVFYGEADGPRAIFIGVGQAGEVAWFPVSEGMAEGSDAGGRRKVRHPLVASFLGTLRIMWFAVRHPGKSAWIDHDTGDVWVADQTA